jgi:hypothetical protein
MDNFQLQKALGSFYKFPIDGVCGNGEKAGIICYLASGNHIAATDQDIQAAAHACTIPVNWIRAVRKVEANGKPFSPVNMINQPPLTLTPILFEGHRFSKATNHKYDAQYPAISYPTWDRSKYPATMAGRYTQLVDAVGLDIAAGFGSASYGEFQIMGENYQACGFNSSFDFAVSMCQNEKAQITAFVSFIKSKGLHLKLQHNDAAGFAKGYNGTGYAQNHYDTNLLAAKAYFDKVYPNDK